jgi:hypothetical protein
MASGNHQPSVYHSNQLHHEFSSTYTVNLIPLTQWVNPAGLLKMAYGEKIHVASRSDSYHHAVIFILLFYTMRQLAAIYLRI